MIFGVLESLVAVVVEHFCYLFAVEIPFWVEFPLFGSGEADLLDEGIAFIADE